jgi:hypothetical protein
MSAYAFQLVGTGLLATFDSLTPAWQHFTFVLPSGIGFGGSITVLLIALISSVPIEGCPSSFLSDHRSSNSYRNELFIPEYWFRGRYHD